MSDSNLIITDALIEQHIHGGFGVDFATTDVDGLVEFANKITDFGVCGFFPTLATDSIANLKRQILRIKEAMRIQPQGSAKILGVNLEACFLNPLKKGIHDERQLLKPTVENYELLEDEIIKIVTLAPELDEDFELCRYLSSKGVTVSAGHCIATDLSAVSQVTHIYNAMGEFSHKHPSTVLTALKNDDISIELIADMRHVQKDVLELTFKLKPHDKIILISDALPIAHSDFGSMSFCNKNVFLKNNRAVDEKGTMAGSVLFVADIIKNLVKSGLLDLQTAVKMASCKSYGPDSGYKIAWDADSNVVSRPFTK